MRLRVILGVLALVALAMPVTGEGWLDRGIAIAKENIPLDTLVPNDPDSANLLNNKGMDLYYQAKYESAILAFDAAIRLDPENAVIWSNKAHALYMLGRYDGAVQALDVAISLDPGNGEYRELKSEVLFAKGDYLGAFWAIAEAGLSSIGVR